MIPPRRNLELKARDPHPARSLKICRRLGAEDMGVLMQQDTYFQVADGMLKLRRESDGPAQLIAYSRAEKADSRESRFRIAEVPDATATEAALAAALDVKARVSKQRRLFRLEKVRIHLDLVVDLGNFIEFEALADGTEPLAFRSRLAELSNAFGIEEWNLVAQSYGDLKRCAGPR